MANESYQNKEEYALHLDEIDPLRSYRAQFHIPKTSEGKEVLYFCGNSLGLQPKTTRAYLEQELKDWEMLGVEGHFHARYPWMPYHELVTEQTARLVGANPLEVVAMNTLTVNLHLMMVSFYRPTATRYKILMEAQAFPSDQYAAQSQARFHGFDPKEAILEIKPRPSEETIRTEDIEAILEQEGDQIALVLLGGVNYYTGQAFELEPIVKKAHEKKCLVGVDLAHATGNLVLKLHDWNVDFAVWCSYKYLNAGPGSIAGCFVHERHANQQDMPRFAGWWGHDKATRFQMGPEFRIIPGAEGWQLSNPSILSFAALRASLDIFDQVGMLALRQKSEQLTGYLEFLLMQQENPDLSIITPSQEEQRGCQLSICIQKQGKTIFQWLQKQGVRCDWREPNVIRVAPVPLYNSFYEVYRFAQILNNATSVAKKSEP